MNTNPTSNINPSMEQNSRNAAIITVVLMVMMILTAAAFAFIGYTNGLPQLYIPAVMLTFTAIFDLYLLSLIRRGRDTLALTIVAALFLLNVLIVPVLVRGTGVIIAALIMVVATAITGLAMRSNYSFHGFIAAVLFGSAAIYLDLSLGGGRIQLAPLEGYSLYAALAIAVSIFIILLREFRRFSLQAKIALGILVTGGIALGVLSFFALDQTGRITDLLAERLEINVRLLAEEQLVSTITLETKFVDQFFAEIANESENLAAYRVALQIQQESLSQGGYWNAAEQLIQLEGGHHGNSARGPSSVFIPSTLPLDEAALTELNTSAYLDFVVPQALQKYPTLLAVYYIDARGVVRYYPNIELASLLPPDFDATKRPYYEIASPLFNPKRLTRWSIPYVDATGGGLVVTAASPVYYGNTFSGVVAADIQLSVITERLASIKAGQSGYAFMVDDAGRLIYMPPAGYEMFGVDPNELAAEEFFKQTILGKGSTELRAFTNRMVAGGSGLGVVPVNGMDTYISFAPIPTNGYSLALVVPVAEMQTTIPATRQETQNQVRAAIQTAFVILIATFIGALIISISLGQLIASPVRRLTEMANRIAGGDLTVQAPITTQDEIGTLAGVFNTMALRLRTTLEGLEQTIAARTGEIERISRSNAYRASQFETIARISRTISSTQSLSALLPHIAETISDELGFYHVGIFLLDTHKEYAVLVAANSAGGKRMLERNHRLRVGETGIVGYVTRLGEPRVALDVGHDAVYFDNPDLPGTHSEVALPLRFGAEIIGALDVQSTETNAFSDEDVNILSTLADQVSIAIQNARSFQQSREALEQAERITAQLSEQRWKQIAARKGIPAYHFDGVEARSLGPTGEKQPPGLTIPLTLRGVQIGSMKLSASDPNRIWNEDELAMAQATAERTALAIENASLLEEAQKRAAKERAIGQISARISNLVSLENILQTALQELGNTLPGTEVAIQFTPANSDESKRSGE